jgi:integral membrane protein
VSATTAPTTDRLRTAFHVVAIAEAVSWAGLLVGMLFKYVLSDNELGVKIFGPIHGGIFVAYVLVTLLVFRPLRWRTGTLVLALVASVPPLCTLVFSRWADRNGRL